MKRGTSQTWYTYDSTGQRVRKVTEKGGITEERLYLGGFEIYRKRQGTTVTLERETLHLMDGNRRIAMVETKTVDSSPTSTFPTTVTRYQLDNHLQSASLELDEAASVISYEEYYPYGDTSYRSARSGVEVSEKRYRYTGKEKDEETGLYYHGARYYAAWLGRWTAADPAGMVDGACLYAYVRNHPTGLVDPDGRAAARFSVSGGEKSTNPDSLSHQGYGSLPLSEWLQFEGPSKDLTNDLPLGPLRPAGKNKASSIAKGVIKKLSPGKAVPVAEYGRDQLTGNDVEYFSDAFLQASKDINVSKSPGSKDQTPIQEYLNDRIATTLGGRLIPLNDFPRQSEILHREIANDPVASEAISEMGFSVSPIGAENEKSVFKDSETFINEGQKSGSFLIQVKTGNWSFTGKLKDIWNNFLSEKKKNIEKKAIDHITDKAVKNGLPKEAKDPLGRWIQAQADKAEKWLLSPKKKPQPE